jgi:hypothetical protein
MKNPGLRVLSFLLVSVLALGASAGVRRRAVAPPRGATADVLGVGSINGAAIAGSVAAVDGPIITLQTGGATPIFIDASGAKIVSLNDAWSTIDDIAVGARITAFIDPAPRMSPSSALHAQLIAIDSHPDLLIAGSIESIDVPGSTLTILGVKITVDENTQFSSAVPTFAPIEGLEDLTAGQIVKVDASLHDSKIVANHVVLVSFGATSTSILKGTVKSISGSSWVIADAAGLESTIVINDKTKIVRDPGVGDEVEVITQPDESGNDAALVIVKLRDADGEAFHIHGWVRSIAPDHWSIGGPPGTEAPELLIRVTPATQIYSNPKAGDIVSVKGFVDSQNEAVATSITKDFGF